MKGLREKRIAPRLSILQPVVLYRSINVQPWKFSVDIYSDKMKLDWRFPLPNTYAGILLSNRLFGVAVWGDDRLFLTINLADFWDRRNTRPINAKMNLAEFRKCFLARDMDGIMKLVDPEDPSIGIGNPIGLPMGRIELGRADEFADMQSPSHQRTLGMQW